MLAPAAIGAPCPALKFGKIRIQPVNTWHARKPYATRHAATTASASNFRNELAHNVQHAALVLGASVLLLTALPQSASAGSSNARQTSGQGDLLDQLLEQNSNSGIRAQGPAAQKRFQELSPNRLVSQSNNQAPTLSSSDTTNADSPLDKASEQVKALGKKAQQTTPRGSPTKPQPLQRGSPLEAVNEVAKPALQVASAEGSFKLDGPVSKGKQGFDFPDPKEAKQTQPAKKGQFFQSSPQPSPQAKPQEAAQAVGDKAAEAGSSSTSLLDGILKKPQQAASAPAQKAEEAADVAKEALPSGNPLTNLFSKPQEVPDAAADKTKEATKKAAPSGNPFRGLSTKPKQASKAAPSKAKESASAAADSAKEAAPASNPLTTLFSKPEQVAGNAADRAKEAAPSSNPLKGLTAKPAQFSRGQGKAAASAVADSAKEAAPSGNNPLTNLLSKKPEQATQSAAKDSAAEAASSNNPFNSLLTKPKQAADTAAGKSQGSDKIKPVGNSLSGLVSKPKQAAEEGKSSGQQAAGGAAAAAAAAFSAVRALAPEGPSLPSPPSVPTPTEALRSSSDTASKVSPPAAPSLSAPSLDSTGLQQAEGLAGAEAIAALVAVNIVGSLTAKKSGRKAYGR